MPHRPTIDGFEFAASGAGVSGVWPIEDFARLRPLLLSDAGAAEYWLDGVKDAQDRPALRLRIRGALQLGCQRCLTALDFPLQIDAMLVLARSEADLEGLPLETEGPDWVVAGKTMDVHDLLEDELLLAVPYAPRHEKCAARARTGAAMPLSPFAELRGMLGGRERETRGRRS
jgi:DUF177 domain-containing protein